MCSLLVLLLQVVHSLADCGSMPVFLLPVITTDDRHIGVSVCADGYKHPMSSLKCQQVRADNSTTVLCAGLEVKHIDFVGWDADFVCDIDFDKCYAQGDIIGGGFDVIPSQRIDLVRCQRLSAQPWPTPTLTLHNGCPTAAALVT